MDSEIQWVSRRLAGLAAKRPGFAVALWGEPGIGKTHAALELLRATPCKSVGVHATLPFEALVQRLPRPKKPSPWLERSLERLGRGEVQSVAAAVQTVAGLLAATAPLVVHVEDMHEADEARLGFWLHLARALPQTRGVALIFTTRVQPSPELEAIRLSPLTREASDALLNGHAGAALPAEALAWVFDRARGNPLFSKEFFAFLARQGFVWNDARRWRWRQPEHQVMPVTLEAIIERTITEVCTDADTQTALEAQAYLDRLEPNLNLEPATWAHVAGLEPADWERAAQHLRAHGVLNGTGFAHPLFREVAAQAVSAGDRTTYAQRALEVLPLEVAAAFVEDAQLGPERTLEWFERASQRALQNGSPLNAARLQAKATGYASGARRAQLALEAATALRLVDLREATRLAEIAASDPGLRERAIALGAELLATQGQGREAERLLEGLSDPAERAVQRLMVRASARDFVGTLRLRRADPRLTDSDDPRVLRAAMVALWSTGEVEQVRAVLVRAEALGDPEPNHLDHTHRLSFANLRANLALHDREYERARAGFADTATQWLEHGDLRGAAIATHNQGLALERLGRHAEAIACYDRSARHSAELGDLRAFAKARLGAGHTRWLLAQYEDSESLFLEARDALTRSAPSDFHVDCEGALSLLYLDWSPPFAAELATKHAQAGLQLAKLIDDPGEIVPSLFNLLLAKLRQGHASQALALADEMAGLRTTHGLDSGAVYECYGRALALEALGEAEQALAVMREAAALPEGSEMFNRKIQMELARMTQDLGLARELHPWFLARGAVNNARILERSFPELGGGTRIAESQPNASTLEVLGSMNVTHASQRRAVRGGKRRELLALLLEARIMGRGDTTRLSLIDALYPDTEDPQASAALKNLVYQLRDHYGAHTVRSSDTGYALGAVTSDAEHFLSTGDTRLWRGPYLEGLDGVGNDTVRETLHLALRERAKALLQHDPAEAARVGRLLCEADPYDLASVRLTLRALRAESNHKSLKSAYARARTALLEIGETLPEHWTDFLEQRTGETA